MEDVVLKAAVRWWRAKRPAHYRLADHIKNPTVGCLSTEERELAEAVGAHERARVVSLVVAVEQRRRQRESGADPVQPT